MEKDVTTIGIYEPYQSMRAVLRIDEAELDHGDYGPQIKCTLVVDDDLADGSDNGTTFTDWFGLDEHTGTAKPGTKTWEVLTAVLLGAPTKTFEIEDLVGGRFASQVGTNKKGTHSKTVFGTISAPPAKKAEANTEPAAGDDSEEADFAGIPF
jgi:hypothetical protein